MEKGFIVNSYRSPGGDCTNRGNTYYEDNINVISEKYDLPKIFSRDKNPNKNMKIIERNVTNDPFPICVPMDYEERTGGSYMFGGNFVWSSDSRFSEIFRGPIKVFDRWEGFHEEWDHPHLLTEKERLLAFLKE